MHLEGRMRVQCNNCGRKYKINVEDLEDDAFIISEGDMGAEIEHDFEGGLACHCGQELLFKVKGFEYPPGGFNYQDSETQGCHIIEEPDVIMDYDLPEPILSAYEQVLNDPQAMYDLEPWQFEECVADVFRRQGVNLTVTQKTRDGGKDIVATFEMGGVLYNTYFECKKYAPNRPVDVKIVRELFAVMERDRIDKGVIVTSSYFTTDAKTEAKKLGIGLIDHKELVELMNS